MGDQIKFSEIASSLLCSFLAMTYFVGTLTSILSLSEGEEVKVRTFIRMRF
jgi:hypothetical protein